MSYPPGDEVTQPEPGKRFMLVDVTIENVGSEPATVSSLLNTEIRDSEGRSYGLSFSATMLGESQQPEGNLAPGVYMRGPFGYQIPRESGPLQWVFKEPFGSGRVVFNLEE
jgi:hypothetical protein